MSRLERSHRACPRGGVQIDRREDGVRYAGFRPQSEAGGAVRLFSHGI